MKLANVTTSQLEYLVAAMSEPTWKHAAAVVGVSPSALSQGITELERRLGARLFDKQGRRRVPTAEANAALLSAREAFEEKLSRIDDEHYRRTFSENIQSHARLLRILAYGS